MAEKIKRRVFYDGIIPEAHSTISQVVQDLDNNSEYGDTDYGHAAGNLIQGAYGYYRLSPEAQRQKLREDADRLIEKYGEEIINFMKPELREALGYPPQKE